MAITLQVVTDKENALCHFLFGEGFGTSIVTPSSYDENLFTAKQINGGRDWDSKEREYLVYTDDEATAAATNYISESLWTFNYEFLAQNSEAIAAIPARDWSKLQELCESINSLVRASLSCTLEEFVNNAIDAENTGRGQFLSSYDGEENEVNYKGTTFYIYRTN